MHAHRNIGINMGDDGVLKIQPSKTPPRDGVGNDRMRAGDWM